MTSGRPRSIIRPSLLDRLVADPGAGRPTELDLEVGVRELQAEVQRDLERLLNSRVSGLADLQGRPEASRSVLGYGLPDISAMYHGSEQDLQRMRQAIREAVIRFEPRLKADSVKVERVLDDSPFGDVAKAAPEVARVRFRISAMLYVEPIREFVSFDTNIRMETGVVEVKEADA